MTFGATCSLACAQVVKNRNALEQQKEFPMALEPIVKQHYVDDYLHSFFIMQEAITTTEQVIKAHQNGGFL